MLWSIFCPVSIFLTLLIVALATNVVLILVKCSTFSLVSHVWVSCLRHGCWIQEPKDVYTHPSSWFCLIMLLLGNKASNLIVCVWKSTCAPCGEDFPTGLSGHLCQHQLSTRHGSPPGSGSHPAVVCFAYASTHCPLLVLSWKRRGLQLSPLSYCWPLFIL